MRTLPLLPVLILAVALTGCDGTPSRPLTSHSASPSASSASGSAGTPPPSVSRRPHQPFQLDGITFVPLPEGYVVMGSPPDEPLAKRCASGDYRSR